MKGYINTLDNFILQSTNKITEELLSLYNDADQSQIDAWNTLINDLKFSKDINNLPYKTIIALEYSLPISGMACDLIICGLNSNNKKFAYIVESKQWNDSFLSKLKFSKYREVGFELHPQIQVYRHKIGFRDYLNIGNLYEVTPFVFVRNSSKTSIDNLISQNPMPFSKNIFCTNSIDEIIGIILKDITKSDEKIISELDSAEYKPSKDIIAAMESIVNKEEPFILTKEQLNSMEIINDAISSGKRIIRITGPAGSGKTAILLNLYVDLLNNMENSLVRPIFISGAQNTALYRSLYPSIESSFVYSFSLDKMVAKTLGNRYVIMMDEAQHNSQGIISNMINRGCTLVLCYDKSQTINANNALSEIESLEKRDDFITISLQNTIRYNGSQMFELNINRLLNCQLNFYKDENYDFRLIRNFDQLQNQVLDLIKSHPNDSVAVTGLLSNDSSKFIDRTNSIFITKWNNKMECQWIPYINEKNYLEKNDGKLWVGTWWLPGLDVDYVVVIVAGDAKLTNSGLVGIPEQAKHYTMMISVAERLSILENLKVTRNSFGKIVTDNYRTSQNIIKYINQLENTILKNEFIREFSSLLKNNYYIMMTRGRKGCFVYFDNIDN